MSVRLVAAIVAALALSACSPAAPGAAAGGDIAALENVPMCGGDDTAPAADGDNPFVERQCQIEQSGERFLVHFAAVDANSADGGIVRIDAFGPDGAVRETITENNVSEYIDPAAVDFDRDGHLDIEIPVASGNANQELILWRFNPDDGHFARIGDVSGVSVDRTADGYLAVPNRGAANMFAVQFFKVAGSRMDLIVEVSIVADGDSAGHVTSTQCTVTQQGPALAQLNMSAEQARTKFCAEPAAQVFAQ